MKYTHLTTDQYNALLKQSHSTIDSIKLYTCTRKANVTIQNFEEAISILKSVKEYMKFKIFDGIIDILDQNDNEIKELKEKI